MFPRGGYLTGRKVILSGNDRRMHLGEGHHVLRRRGVIKCLVSSRSHCAARSCVHKEETVTRNRLLIIVPTLSGFVNPDYSGQGNSPIYSSLKAEKCHSAYKQADT